MRVVALALAAVTLALMATGAAASAQPEEPATLGTETLTVTHQAEDELELSPIIDGLHPETLLTIRADGFDPDTTGTVRQCTGGESRRCRNTLSVRFDADGAALFQYFISNAFTGGGSGEVEPCRLEAPPCTLELQTGDKITVIDTVFVDDAPTPGRIEVNPRRDLVVGDTVTVTASEFQPGVELTLAVCAAPSTSGARCGAPGPVVPLTIGDDGTATTSVTLDVGEVGADRVACGRRVACHLVVTSEQIGVRARPAALTFTEFPGADYDTARVVIGLAAATILALVAWRLLRSTPWDPPAEADGSAIDLAEFANLDLEAAQFEEKEAAAASRQSLVQ